MNRTLWIAIGLLSVGLFSSARYEEPPKDPIDCVFCGGNPEQHATRMIVLQGQFAHLSYRLLTR